MNWDRQEEPSTSLLEALALCFDHFQCLVLEAIGGQKNFLRPEAIDLSQSKDWWVETTHTKFEPNQTSNNRENGVWNFKLKLQLFSACSKAALRSGSRGPWYLWAPSGIRAITLRAEAPGASKVFSFWPPGGQMEAARSVLQRNPKSPCQELSREVWHTSLAQKMTELEPFEVFPNFGHILVTDLWPSFLRLPLTSDPTYGVFPDSAWWKEGISQEYSRLL